MKVVNKGLFCVFEGIDGSGKTTLIEKVYDKLKTKNKKLQIILLKEPTNLKTGLELREHLIKKSNLSNKAWLDLFIQDRKENYIKNICPALNENKIILQDRYFYSTAAYQGTELNPKIKNLNQEFYSPEDIIKLNLKEKFLLPELLFYLKIDPKISFERINSKRAHLEIFESIEKLKIISKNYEKVLPTNTIFLDAMENLEELSEIVIQKIEQKL